MKGKKITDGAKNIIFDLGGVILNIDPQRTVDAFNRIVPQFGKNFAELSRIGLFLDFERGKINARDFRDGIRNYTKHPVNDKDVDAAWNAMVLDIPMRRMEMLMQLKTILPTYLLSNTNEIHLENFNNQMMRSFGLDSLDIMFHKAHYSHIMGLRKPEKLIFELVLEEHKLVPRETLFIDDIEENILAAEKLGMRVYHLKPGDEISKLIVPSDIVVFQEDDMNRREV